MKTTQKIVIVVFVVMVAGLLLAAPFAGNDQHSGWKPASAGPWESSAEKRPVADRRELDSLDSQHYSVPAGSQSVQRSPALDSGGTGQGSLELPDACLADLPGFGHHSGDTRQQVQMVRELIESRVLVSTPQPDSHNPDATIRSLPPVNSVAALGLTESTPAVSSSFVTESTFQVEESSEHESIQSVAWEEYNPHARTTESGRDVSNLELPSPASVGQEDPHAEIYQESRFPSATKCASCHQQIFDEWAASSHAYASISPMFQRFEQKINDLSQGTIGYFCLRCHAPVATTVGLRRDQAIWDGPRVFREGVTCIACHRVKENYTKSNGERRIEPGDVYDPVFSAQGRDGTAIVNKYAEFFKVRTGPEDKRPGQPIHKRAIEFEQLSQSDFCMSCHQVAVQPGIKLEVVWDQYRASPAWKDGTTCQDCHMGIVPGRDEGYSIGPAAVVDGKVVTAERKHSNHAFYGPGYSIAHPGVFPQNVKADRWKFNDWLAFDWRAGWGTDDFEDAVEEGLVATQFPPAWTEVDDRYDAREIIEDNLEKLGYKKDLRRQVLENGSRVEGPFFQRDPNSGEALRFHYCVSNLNKGHNMPSGSLGAQPQLWLNVALIGPDGTRLWETGYLDSVGDLADLHSSDVLERRVPLDKQLFNLQTKFLTTNVKGTDREMYLPINVDIDQLPFIRPTPQPVSVLNHPPFIRMESHSIPPLGSRKAKYVVPAALMQQPGTYRLSVRLRSRAEPIYFMNFVGATPEMIRMMNEWIADAHVQTVVFEVR